MRIGPTQKYNCCFGTMHWISQCNHSNTDSVIDDIKQLGPLKFVWEGNEHGEKHMQTAKNEFVSKKGNFGEVLIKKIHAKKYQMN